ncbi:MULTISPECIES: hypothetical protein [unclassified Exiguobacterium]|uniref:hypothetical protein n=1 Tax=unclassified Exiguobacterium TaxID=2644629 RepID=UPI001BE5153A|nr:MULTISPECIES: hypothetical protein [unclassified Exiguobacterium]
MALLMKLYDLESKYEKNPLEVSKRYKEQRQLDYENLFHKWEAGDLFPGETIVRPKKWWQFFKSPVVVQLPGKQISKPAFDKWYKKRVEIQKLLYVAGGATEDEIWKLPLRRHLDFYQMVHLLNDQYGLFYRAVIHYQQGEVELSSFVVGPSAIYLLDWLDGEESIYHIKREKLWREQPFKAPTKNILNPLISLKRTEDILRLVLGSELELPIERVVIASKGYFDQLPKESKTTYVSKVDFAHWLHKMNTSAPYTKAFQMRVCEKILKETSSITFQMAVNDQENERIQT